MKAGNVVHRNGTLYLIVESTYPTFTGKPAYGLVQLDTGKYLDVDLQMASLKEILDAAGFEFFAYSVSLIEL